MNGFRRAFVAGWPVAHSRSPVIHRHWLDVYGISGDYVREPVPPHEAHGFFESLNERGYVGGNVTVPHKETAFSACAETTPVAARLGAVNTVWLEDGRLHGDNTDVYGFTANLDEQAPGWRRPGAAAVVLGAGGASRAVMQGLLEAGFGKIAILNRTEDRAHALARLFGAKVYAGPLDEIGQLLPHADMVVNSTSAGLTGDDLPPLDWSAALPGTIAVDIVYVPLRTPFLDRAARHGIHIVDGLGMLLHQAVPGFQRWFGPTPSVTAELRDRVLADLSR